jgi:hypothetical protein
MTSIIPFLTLLLTPDLGQTSAVEAAAVLDKAIQAHGGLAALQKIQDITREFDGLATSPAQGIRTETPAANPGKIATFPDAQWQHILETQDATRPGGPESRITPGGQWRVRLCRQHRAKDHDQNSA